jgi:hypothetical protein
MNTWELTAEQIRAAGLRALERELGTVGMVRFLQQFSRGSGDYTKERDTWLADLDLDAALAEIRERRATGQQ